jgi:CRP-like cAMP-binding protein
MTRRHQRPFTVALKEKETIVRIQTDSKSYAEFLHAIPVLSTCTRDVLEEFVSHGVDRLHCAAGKSVSSESDSDQNLYVMVNGSASLDAGDDVRVALEPGDYFGSATARQHHMTTSVIADRDVEVLVIRPQEVAQLAHASSRDRHPSQIEWRSGLSNTPQSTRKAHRRPAMAS